MRLTKDKTTKNPRIKNPISIVTSAHPYKPKINPPSAKIKNKIAALNITPPQKQNLQEKCLLARIVFDPKASAGAKSLLEKKFTLH
jgi:hypothetical protein